MKPPAIHQFHSGSAVGDAVTNAMLLTCRLLRQFGFDSHIYVEQIAPELEDRLKPHRKLGLKKQDLLLVHHSMGHDLQEFILGLAGKKILVYHNITPPQFFRDNLVMQQYAGIGRQMLTAFCPVMDAALCDSRLNAAELGELGYTRVWELPLLVCSDTLAARKWDPGVTDAAAGIYTLLFVGRIAPNKCQHDLIAMARHLGSLLDRPFQLVLAGGYSRRDPYYIALSNQVIAAGLQNRVRFTGKISDEQLYGWYRAADVFVCMSEHEGFGVPLVEAMAFDVPVIAYKSSSVPDTLGGAGILVTKKDPVKLAALISVLSRDRALKRTLVRGQARRAAQFHEHRLAQRFYRFLTEQGIEVPHPPAQAASRCPAPLAFQVEGPFETAYSLALVNRETALALDRIHPGQVGLFATEGPGDYAPDPAAVRSIPGLDPLWQRGVKAGRPRVAIRNLYPPRVADMDGRINLLSFAWEESMLPFEWVRAFNRHLDGLAVVSQYVKKVLIDNGVGLPVKVAGNGTDHVAARDPVPFPLGIDTGFTFLHISSGFPRKGIDLLLQAFARTFSKADDTGLLIKTFPNIHNQVEDQVRTLKQQYPDGPPVTVINQELAPGHMAFLYQACDALVAPSRGEGFGLPLAEAMNRGLPVITTAYGGQTDFCTPETAWLVNFSFEPAQTHLDLYDSVWAAPDVTHLGQVMKTVRTASGSDLAPRLDAARNRVNSAFTWDLCGERIQALVQQIRQTPPLCREKIRLGWVSSWDTRCGIAAYSKFLVDALPNSDITPVIFASEPHKKDRSGPVRVHRCWTGRTGSVEHLVTSVDTQNPDALVIQFNFAFFTPDHLARIIRASKEKNRVVIICFHATKDVDLPGQEASLGTITRDLALADRLLVHGIEDLNRFRSWGLHDNTAIFPHGVVLRRPKKTRTSSTPLLASYGFMLPHKGLEQLITAFADIRKQIPALHLVMVNARYPDPVSDDTLERCRDLIRQYHLQEAVTLVTDFLPDDQSLSLLESATLIVFPYQATAESSSAAVRTGLAARRPVACTPLEIFNDVTPLVHFLPGTTPRDLARGIVHLLKHPDILDRHRDLRDRWLACHDWQVLGERLAGMIRGLMQPFFH
jgi:glycosyltransferase involved in cell wall biosynthesis